MDKVRYFGTGDAPVEFVQLYGERNSGTTWLAALLDGAMRRQRRVMGPLKSDAHPLGIDPFGYKHWTPDLARLTDPRRANTLFVVLYRNPYRWLRAMMDRPYALSRSIGGRSVSELTTIQLVGHLRGRETRNELDPETGETQTIFQLRGRKFRALDALRGRVERVLYIRLEDALDDPAGLIAELAKIAPDAFRADADAGPPPPGRLIRERRSDMPFSPDDRAVIDAALDWTAEALAGYAPGSTAPASSPRRTPVMILHGASSVGKSYLMQRLSAEIADLTGIEMDDCRYWEDRAPDFSSATITDLVPGTTEADTARLSDLAERLSPKARLCVEHLLGRLADVTCDDTLLVTGGALPDPGQQEAFTIYDWLSDRLPVDFRHMLIEIPPEIHIERITARGRSHLTDEIVENYAKKAARRDRYDAVIADHDSLRREIARWTGLAGAAPDARPSRPAIRIRSAALDYLQIYGERNSGTKYLSRLLASHMRSPGNLLGSYGTRDDPTDRARRFGYKHYYPRPEKLAKGQHRALFVVVTKNPYTWIRSMLAKPYHFRADLEGASIADLPSIRLHGTDVHGRDIPDIHPTTGDRLTLFELRRYKILGWEALRTLADNVVHVNYEDALVYPEEVLQRIAEAFPSLFHDGPPPDHAPDPVYLKKYVTPTPFTDDEMTVMNTHLDWSAEALAGYERDNLFVSS